MISEVRQQWLRDAWHGPDKLDAIAAAANLGPRHVRRFWEGEKAAGRLPSGPRPHFAARSSARVPLAPSALACDGSIGAIVDADDTDASPIAQPNPCYASACARSLAALHHAHDPDAMVVEVPTQYLAQPPVTQDKLMAMARALDQQSRARRAGVAR
ncbi:hypothetical protein [Rhodopseudomonas sp. BR0G17]|uniref:hypothetical protein n=1 Tax=Rhodopseudomonas sp. BR0G17 TaxID=2269368 RepID=UPI0013DFA6F5|nr:hypothetical protein [Rhodopseudomonas sp. BR0G17]NEW96618.1 hypothetical protein [Rhodopseudomonas sp. BR0G17]